MTREEIMALNMEQIEERSNDLATELASAETAEAMDDIQAEIDAIEERKIQITLEIEQRKKDLEAVIKGKGAQVEELNKGEEKMEIRNTPEYINAYAEYIKTGKDMELRTLLSENATNGTVPVPEFVYDIVKTAWNKEGIMSLVRKSYLKGNLKVGFEISGGDATVHTEGAAAVSEESLVLGIVNMVPKSIKKWIDLKVA